VKNPLLQLVDIVGGLARRVKKLEARLTAPVFKEVPAKSNWIGVPNSGLTWDEVSTRTQDMSPIASMTLPVVPEFCPICKRRLLDYKSDWQKIEGGGQYMVVGNYCPEGHWTHLEWA
jgi:hypothetical protein